MKKNNSHKLFLSLFIGGLSLSTVITGCNSSPKDKLDNATTEVMDASADLVNAKDDYLAEVAAFKTDAEMQILANEQKLEEYNNDIKIKKTDELKNKIEVLNKKTVDLKKKLADFKANDGKETWSEFKTEFNHDMDGLGDALNDLTTQNTPK